MAEDALKQLAAARRVLEQERNALIARLSEIDAALGNQTEDRRPQVGDDKVAAVLDYMRGRGWVRQASIAKDTGLNPGTVSEALIYLLRQAAVENGPKENRSTTWRVTRTRK